MDSVLWIPSNDTHADFMGEMILSHKNYKCMILPIKEEGAGKYLSSKGIKFQVYSEKRLEEIAPSLVVFGNDWGWEERDIIYQCRNLGIPTVVIQEGPLDFMDETGHRMKTADYAFIMGTLMKGFLKRKGLIVTGNPKFDEFKELPKNAQPMVMVNYNFTYGVYEDCKEDWLKDVAETCDELGVNYFVSRHPRNYDDLTAFPVKESSASVVKDQIKDSSILISRFSTVIHEAILYNRNVIYYNPFGEHHRIFNEDRTGAIGKAENREELKNCLKVCLLDSVEDKFKRDFLKIQCNIGEDGTAHAKENILSNIKKLSDRSLLRQLLLKARWFATDLKTLIKAEKTYRNCGAEEFFTLIDEFFKQRKYRFSKYLASKLSKLSKDDNILLRAQLLKKESSWMIKGAVEIYEEFEGGELELFRYASAIKKCGEFHLAEKLFLRIFEESSDRNLKGASAYHLGDIFRYNEDSTKARYFFEKSLEFKPQHYKAKSYLSRYSAGQL